MLMPGGSSPVQKSKLQGEQIQRLRSELKAAQDGCRSQRRLQAEADKRAGEYLAQLQTRGEYILLLQAQLNDLEQVNTQLREQLASGGAAAAAATASTSSPEAAQAARHGRRSRGSGSDGGGSGSRAAASSNGDHHAHEPQQDAMIPSAQHEAVVQQLQAQLAMQTEQLQQLRQELANATLAPPAAATAAAPSPAEAAAAAVGSGSGCSSTDDLAGELDTAREAATAAAAGLQGSPAAAAGPPDPAALEQKHQQLQKQFDELTAFVKQLEAQAAQREALMGGLLAQVRAAARAARAISRGVQAGWAGLA